MVLLEVKILSIELGDGFDSVFDIQFSTVASFLQGNTTGTSLTIEFDSTVGVPPTDNLVVEGSAPYVPLVEHAVIDFVP